MENKLYTRKELLERIKENDTNFFYSLYEGYDSENDEDAEIQNEYKEIWYQNLGDGNELNIALNFPNENITILMSGYYSSYDSSRINKVSIAGPYEFKETRYKPLSQQEIRDLNIEELIKN